MTRAELHLSLLLAQAQKVGRALEFAAHAAKQYGRYAKPTKQAWRVYYEQERKQNKMRVEFVEAFTVKES